ncbi:MAG TPA: hypothetical protein PKE04_10160, partial [Clostridia bacterium]|nr:hypothetical protein [Clostridia bacterium]
GLAAIERLARRINAEWACDMTMEASTDRLAVLPGADFVILSVAIDRERCWKMDHALGLKYGIRHYAENGGPGGFFHAARNAALLLPILRDMERLAPGALALNFTNPMTRVCTLASRYTKVNMVGICHQLDFGYMMIGRLLGKDLGLDVDTDYLFRWNNTKGEREIAMAAHERVDILAAGVNHFTWFLSVKDKETGEELLPLFHRRFLEQTAFEPYTRALIETFGTCPTSGDAHCLEYMPYTGNVHRDGWGRYDIQMYPLDSTAKRDRSWNAIYAMADGKMPLDELRLKRTERAEQILEAVWHGRNAHDMAVNIVNADGLIANMDRDAVVEVPAVMGNHGVRGIAVGNLPPVAAAFCNRQKTIVDLAVKAMAEGDRAAALQALALDPMIDDLDVAKDILRDGLELFAEYLPQFRGGAL